MSRFNKILCDECELIIREAKFAYKHWRHSKWQGQKCIPILALHGWLDNANSFDLIAPQLLEHLPIEFMALDLAGHGYSDNRHPQGSYNIWSDLIDLALIVEELNFESYIVMGHSRGAMIASLFAATRPDKISHLILLDSLLPMAQDPQKVLEQLTRHISQELQASTKTMPSYQDKEQALQARCKAANMSVKTAEPIVERGIKKVNDKRFEWRSDPRLTFASAVKLSKQQNQVIFEGISVPILLLMADKGVSSYVKDDAVLYSLEANPNLNMFRLKGSHHFHLEENASRVVVEKIRKFLS